VTFPSLVLLDLPHIQISQVLSLCYAIPTSLLLSQDSGLVFLFILLSATTLSPLNHHKKYIFFPQVSAFIYFCVDIKCVSLSNFVANSNKKDVLSSLPSNYLSELSPFPRRWAKHPLLHCRNPCWRGLDFDHMIKQEHTTQGRYEDRKTPKKLDSICCPQCRETNADTLKWLRSIEGDQELQKRWVREELT
jgi:hypothetical protein